MNSSSSVFSEDGGAREGQQQGVIGRALVRLEGRLESVEIKVMSLSKIVRLLQQYSEKKDQQYEKQSQNMQLFDSRLAKIDSMQVQLTEVFGKCDELTSHYHAHSLKIDSIGKLLQERQASIRNMQERLGYQVEQFNRKINKIQSNMLLQIRQGSKGQEEQSKAFPGNQNYVLEQLSFRMGQLEGRVWGQLQKLRAKLQKISVGVRKGQVGTEDNYGLVQQRMRKSKSRSGREKQKSQLKRLKSK